MGFASAFASGLIKGFHQNILNEQKARAKDEEKLDGYRQLLMKSVLSGDDVNTSAINAVKDMIKSGEKQLEDREDIDIFGRPSERLKMDMLDMAGFVNNTNDTIMIGSVAFPKPKNYDDKAVVGKPGVRASMIFDKLNSLGKNKVQTMFSNKEDLMALKNFYDANVSFFLKDQVFVKDQKGIVLHKGPSELIPVHNWMKTLVPTKSDYQSKVEALKGKNILANSEFLLPTGFKDVLGDADAVTTPEKLGLDNQELKSLSGLAELQGYTDLGEFIYTSASLYTKPVDFIEGINHTAALFKMNAHQPRSMEEKSAIGKYLVETAKVGDAPLKAAYIMSPLVLNKADLASMELKKYGMIPKQSKDNFNENWKKLTGKTLDKFDEIFRATRDAEDKLIRYADLLDRTTLKPESYLAEGYKFVRSIFGIEGTIDQAMTLIKGIDDTNRGQIASSLKGEFDQIDEEFGKDTDKGKLLAQIAVLKYTIAADLARAEDDQGRLSDQDLQRNLNKLGTFGFGTLPDARTSAREVLFDVQRRLKNLTVINDVRTRSEAPRFISLADRKLLQGDRMARNALQQYGRDNPDMAKMAEVASGMNYDDLFNEEKYEVDLDLMGIDGGVVYQNKQTGNYIVADPSTKKVLKVLTDEKQYQKHIKVKSLSELQPEIDSGGEITSKAPSPSPNLPSQVEIQNQNQIVTDGEGNQTVNGRKGRLEVQGQPPNEKLIFIFE
tara:strand:- start:3039 stop:5204 length:2166 start_codon:yes stop_codon:yes gene_type:complete